MTTLAYIAAPYGDPDPNVRAWHVARASALGRLALALGCAPVVVHPSIAAGVYGDDADPEQRAAGMAATLAVLDGVLDAGGCLIGLLRDDGSASDGTAAEIARCVAVSPDCRHDARTWADWRDEFAGAGILPLWESLTVDDLPEPPEGMEWSVDEDGDLRLLRADGSHVAFLVAPGGTVSTWSVLHRGNFGCEHPDAPAAARALLRDLEGQ